MTKVLPPLQVEVSPAPVQVTGPSALSRWRPGLRWFAAEFLVVVAGILVALALQAWWADRQDRAAELQLLRQMRAELARDADDVRRSIERSRQMHANVVYVLGHFEKGSPYSDTLRARFARLGEAVPLSAFRRGPYATLESRGLALVTNDSLRMAISDFYEVRADQAGHLNEWLRSGEVRWMPALVRRFRYDYDKTTDTATPRNYADLLRDEEFMTLLDDYAFYLAYTVPWKQDLARHIDALLAAIERELARRGVLAEVG